MAIILKNTNNLSHPKLINVDLKYRHNNKYVSVISISTLHSTWYIPVTLMRNRKTIIHNSFEDFFQGVFLVIYYSVSKNNIV